MTQASSSEQPKWTFDKALIKPVWSSTTVTDESVLFMKEANSEPNASLIFEATKILSVKSSAGDVTYREGSDYVCAAGSRTISLPKGSRIPSKTMAELRVPAGSQPFRLTASDGNGEFMFGAKHEYHDLQVLVSYTHKAGEWTGYKPEFSGTKMPETMKKLSSKSPLNIALLGDSISTGCNASGWAGTAPFQPDYGTLLVKTLEAAYGSKVILKNYSVGGMDSAWGAREGVAKLAKPVDLAILAFGMNDASGRAPAEFQQHMKAQIDAIAKSNPNCEFILVSSMLGNPGWTYLKADLFPQYRDGLAKLCGEHVILADLTAVYAEILKHKRYIDMTGNGVNHPNDFGHRLYAQVLAALLVKGLDE